ncbi:MAG: hypothetical protein EP297_00140 [Gammaproteobacteria bacterium]|nr:MAG: hypothetical protein EP297_00140 [Gammaproteobacteria bacterium]
MGYRNESTEEFEVLTGQEGRLNVSARQNEVSATTTRVTLNASTATTLSASNPDRKYFSVTVEPGTSNVDVIIRYYPASTDNIKHGADVLTRRLLGSDNLFRSRHEMNVNAVYTGEVSGIMDSGSVDVFVTEY